MANPYEVTYVPDDPPMPAKGDWAPWEMQYAESWRFVTRNPKWLNNVLIGFLCLISTQVIPVVGQLVLLGYMYEVTVGLHRTNGQTYPDFDFNRIGDYLLRALGPFLVSLVGAVAFLIPAAVLMVAALLLVAAAGSAGEATAVAIVLLAILVGVMGPMTLFFAYAVLFTPPMLHGGMTSNVGNSFNFSWAFDFVKKTWVELILVNLFVAGVMLLGMLVGMAALCIGSVFALAFIYLMLAHLNFQLYRLYLSRGGEAIMLTKPIGP
jgi:hypothetical protein